MSAAVPSARLARGAGRAAAGGVCRGVVLRTVLDADGGLLPSQCMGGLSARSARQPLHTGDYAAKATCKTQGTHMAPHGVCVGGSGLSARNLQKWVYITFSGWDQALLRLGATDMAVSAPGLRACQWCSQGRSHQKGGFPIGRSSTVGQGGGRPEDLPVSTPQRKVLEKSIDSPPQSMRHTGGAVFLS